MAESLIFKGFTGLNNRLDQMRHQYNPETGIGELAEAVNCDIDDSGMISRRYGKTLLSETASTSVFCDGGDCFAVQDRTDDAALYQVGTDFSLTGVRSGLTKGARVSFKQSGAQTFYANGQENGVIEGGISSAWPTHTHVGATTTRQFYPAPVGTHLEIFLGRMWIADGSVLWVSEPYAFGKFDKSRCFFQFGTDLKMIKAVAGGMWVSDGKQVGFIQSEGKFEDMRFIKRSSTPAHEYSANIQLVDLRNTAYEIPGLSAVWSSNDGVTVGTESGELIVITEDKLYYPQCGSGTTVVIDKELINSVY